MQFRYNHADHTRVPRDVRRNRVPELSLEHTYFVGIRIWTDNQLSFRHALILADDFDNLLDGIADEFNVIINQPSVAARREISLVFVRNLLTQTQDMRGSEDYRQIYSEIQQAISTRNDDLYMVFGLIEDRKICLIQLETKDALKAIGIVRSLCNQQYQGEFIPLEVCQAHPATAECYSLYEAAVERIKLFIGGDPAEHKLGIGAPS